MILIYRTWGIPIKKNTVQMPSELFNRMREIILDSVEVLDDRIVFDLTKAEEKGHNHTDVVIAENILMKDIHFTHNFDKDIKDIWSYSKMSSDPDFNPIVLYVPTVKILFVINDKEEVCTSIYEEELLKEAAIKETFYKFVDTAFSIDDFKKKRREFRW